MWIPVVTGEFSIANYVLEIDFVESWNGANEQEIVANIVDE
jgi:hypothetical protein